jgi:hypothetical protein
MVMLNKIYSTMGADFKITRHPRTGKFEAYIRPMGESWTYYGTYESAEQAYKEAENAAEVSEIMARYEVDDYYLR